MRIAEAKAGADPMHRQRQPLLLGVVGGRLPRARGAGLDDGVVVADEAAEIVGCHRIVGHDHRDLDIVAVGAHAEAFAGRAPALLDRNQVAVRDDEGGDGAVLDLEQDDALDRAVGVGIERGHRLEAAPDQRPVAGRQRHLAADQGHHVVKDGADRRVLRRRPAASQDRQKNDDRRQAPEHSPPLSHRCRFPERLPPR